MKLRYWLRRHHLTIEWMLGTLALVLPVLAWASSHELNSDTTLYDIFPPLGLIAFGLMWTHFVMGALRRFSRAEPRRRDTYMAISMGIVLALLILHPGLLWLALYLDGFGLPPASYITVYNTQLLAVLLGTLGLIIFLAFELHRWFSKKKWWRYIELAQIVGMLAIFVHALELGSELRLDWFRTIWWLYGISLAAAIIYTRITSAKRGTQDGKEAK